MYQIKIESFEGPLDLLLKLIEQEKLGINEISLSYVTDEYLKYIKQIEEKNPEEMADFLVIAAKLILIKSKSLLPSLNLELEEDEMALEEQLKMYKEFILASERLNQIIEQKKFSFSREKNILYEKAFCPPEEIDKEKICISFKEIINSIKPILKLPEQALKRAISIQDKIDHIQKLIKQKTRFVFNKILNDTKDKTERVVSFLALLELTKNKLISVNQQKLFDDITIKKV